jgi:RNA polymerase sigma-70 factor (ECF subfamily)
MQIPIAGRQDVGAAEEQNSALLADEEIVRRVLGGDLAAYELIMRRYNQRLFRIVRSIVADEGETEDVLQEAYVRAFQHLSQFAGLAKFSTWLTKIAIHEALARRRKLSRMESVDLNAPENVNMAPLAAHSGAEQEASLKELRVVLTGAVDALPDDLRTVFAMRMIEGLDTNETASCLDLTEANVKVRLHRARAALREHIDAQIGVEVRELYQFGGQRCDRIVKAVLARIMS